MKTKFKDLLLYSLATIGVVALFISTTQIQQSEYSAIAIDHDQLNNWIYVLDSRTGEVYQTKHYTNEKKRVSGKQEWIKITSPIK
jgi:hypothetical protein